MWWPLEPPTRFTVCDQTYTRLSEERWSLAEAAVKDPQASSAILVPATFGTLPLGLPTPSSYSPGAGYNGCGHLILLKLGADSYVLYYKLGGP